jgi:DNA-binding transcriptional MocR family regulator
MDDLEKMIIEKKPKGFYLVTTFHNPSSQNLNILQRNQLYKLAIKYRFYIISDDVYETLYFNSSERIPPLFFCSDSGLQHYLQRDQSIIDYDNNSSEFIVSLFSFSKIISPGWRMVTMFLIEGLIHAHIKVIEMLSSQAMVRSGGGLNNVVNQFFRSYLELNYIEYDISKISKWLDYLKTSYSDRVEKAYDILHGSFAFEISKPRGGYFLWIRLNNKVNLEKMNKLFEENLVKVTNGSIFVLNSEIENPKFFYLQRRLRIAYTFLDDGILLKGFSVLKKCIEDSLDS